MRDAGVGVDDLRRPLRVLRIHFRGDKHRFVAERPGVEDRRDLADDPAVEQALRALERVGEGELGLGGDGRERLSASGNRDWSRFISRLSASSSGIAAPSLRERSFGCGTFTGFTAMSPPPSRSR